MIRPTRPVNQFSDSELLNELRGLMYRSRYFREGPDPKRIMEIRTEVKRRGWTSEYVNNKLDQVGH